MLAASSDRPRYWGIISMQRSRLSRGRDDSPGHGTSTSKTPGNLQKKVRRAYSENKMNTSAENTWHGLMNEAKPFVSLPADIRECSREGGSLDSQTTVDVTKCGMQISASIPQSLIHKLKSQALRPLRDRNQVLPSSRSGTCEEEQNVHRSAMLYVPSPRRKRPACPACTNQTFVVK